MEKKSFDTKTPTFSARIEANPLKKICDFTNVLCDECVLQFDSDKVYTRFVDASHVAMGAIEVSKKFFVSYDVTKPGAIGLDTAIVNDFIKTIEKKDVIEITKDESRDEIVLSTRNRTEEIKTLATEGFRWPSPPTLELDAHLEIFASELKDIVFSIEKKSDVILVAGNNVSVVFSDVDETTKIEKRYPYNPLGMGLSLECKEQFKSMYPLDYLKKMVATTKEITHHPNKARISPLSLSLGTDYPIQIKGRIYNVDFTYLLAPRIEGE